MQANGYLLSANGATNHVQARSGDGRGSGEKANPSNRVRLNGNIARRKPGKRIREYWDIDLPGFGLREFRGHYTKLPRSEASCPLTAPTATISS